MKHERDGEVEVEHERDRRGRVPVLRRGYTHACRQVQASVLARSVDRRSVRCRQTLQEEEEGETGGAFDGCICGYERIMICLCGCVEKREMGGENKRRKKRGRKSNKGEQKKEKRNKDKGII